MGVIERVNYMTKEHAENQSELQILFLIQSSY